MQLNLDLEGLEGLEGSALPIRPIRSLATEEQPAGKERKGVVVSREL